MKAPVIIRLLPTRIRKIRYRINVFINKRPLSSFFAVLLFLLLLIVVSHFLNQPKPQPAAATMQPKVVNIYRIGSAPRITVQAQIKKTGVIQIVALTNGIVQTLFHKEGDRVRRGEMLVGMSQNYQGGNAFSLQRQLAQKQYQNILDTFKTQKDIIQKQRDIAQKTNDNSSALRDITNQSVGETQDLINLNQDILSTLEDQINTLEQNSTQNASLILATKQLKSQFLSATNQAKQALRNAQYQGASDKPPADLANLQKDVALRQLDMQDKQLDLSREVSAIQVQIAQVNEGLMFPTAPFSGTVERVFVKEKEAVNPGTPLLIISQTKEDDPVTAVAFVPREIAARVSQIEQSTLHIGDKITYNANPTFISTEAVEGTMYALYYPIPDNNSKQVVSNGFITVDIPIGYYDSVASAPYVPLDAIYQTRDKAYMFVIDNGVAKSREIEIGQVYGRFVEVTNGIGHGDEIILDRTVIDGDKVTEKL